MDRRSRFSCLLVCSFWALATRGGLGCASAGDVPREPPATPHPAPDFPLLDAEIDRILWDEQDPDAYSPLGQRDPFRAPQDVVAPVNDAGPDLAPRASCPLAQLTGTHVDELRLEGVVRVSRGGAARATFAGVDGRGAIAGVGDLLTDDCAVVEAIDDERVVVSVTLRGQRGERSERTRVIALHAVPAEP